MKIHMYTDPEGLERYRQGKTFRAWFKDSTLRPVSAFIHIEVYESDVTIDQKSTFDYAVRGKDRP